MKNSLALIPLLAVIMTGCHKTPPPSADSAPPPTQDAATPAPAPQPGNVAQPAQPAQPLPPPPPSIAANADNSVRENVAGIPDPFLTGQLKVFIQQKGRMPISFTEFAHTRLDSIPRPPEGKKWVIDTAASQVKAVSQ